MISRRVVVYYTGVRWPPICSGDREVLESVHVPAVVCERTDLPLAVKCYSGFKYNERPSSFFLDQREFMVMDIEGSWYEEDEAGYARHACFRVRADDGDLYLLRYDQSAETWSLRRVWRLSVMA